MMNLDLLYEVSDELTRAQEKFAPFNSGHEAWAALREEVDELWDEVKATKDTRPGHFDAERRAKLRKEAIQVAAMAVRFVKDICEKAS